jgi:hypothetical protein
MITSTAVVDDSGFTYEELREWLRGGAVELPTAPGYFTTEEWKEKLGCSIERTREALKLAYKQGKLEKALTYEEGYTGYKHQVVKYRFVRREA